jgi:hypothetical protein
MSYTNFDDPYVYGPISQEELENLTVSHRMSFIGGQIYIGVVVELQEFSDRLVEKEPIVYTQPVEE